MDKNEVLDMELHALSTTDRQDIECHEFDIYVEDKQGREGSYSACIVDVAGRALARIGELEGRLSDRGKGCSRDVAAECKCMSYAAKFCLATQQLEEVVGSLDGAPKVEVELALKHLGGGDGEAVERLQVGLQWISTKDRWPEAECGNKILAFGEGYVFECEYDGEHWCSLGGDEFTHWMPLNHPAQEAE